MIATGSRSEHDAHDGGVLSTVSSSNLAPPQHPHHHIAHPHPHQPHHHAHQPTVSYHEANMAMVPGRLLRKTARTVLRAATYAFVARVLFGIIKAIMKRGFSSKLAAAVREEAMSSNPWKWATLVGALSSYRGVRVLLERAAGMRPHVASLLAGGVASLGTLVMNVQTRTELALYVFVRALHGLAVTFAFPRLPVAAQKFQHWDVVAMSATAAQILYGIFFSPDCHSPSYQHFLISCTMFDARVISGTAGLYRSQVVPDLVDYCWEKKLPLPSSAQDLRHACTMIHPGMDCNQSFANFVLTHIRTFSFPTYFPLKIVTTLLFGHKKLLKHPVETMWKMVSQSFTSALFLTLYCAGPFRVLCFFNQRQWRSPLAVGLACGAFAGPPTLLEPKSRRLDLALFCAMHALRNAYLSAVSVGWIPRPNRNYLFAMITFAFSVLFYQVDYHADSAHPNIRGMISWLLQEPHTLHHVHQQSKSHALTDRERSLDLSAVQ